jgi:hypothetical protein
MSLGVYSMYRLTDVIAPIDSRGRATQPPFIDLRPRVTETASNDVFIRTTSRGETWGRLGLRYLTSASYWWVIADLSDVVDPFEELELDTTLRCPNQSRFFFDILPGDY